MENKEIESKGIAGERALEKWLKRQGFSFLALCQDRKHFAPAFRDNLKRPDFLVLLESVGMIAVDAKNRKRYDGVFAEGAFTLPYEKEFQKALTFERVFRVPLWYAYQGEKEGTWYWISALKAIEVGEIRERNHEHYLEIKLKDFEQIESNADFGKLYTHRLPKLGKIRAVEP